jgi:hypothetical protein
LTQFLTHKKQEIQAVAIAEVLNPAFELTKQFLAMNKIVFKDNMPFVEDVILREEEQTAEVYAAVYFPIEIGCYYFVIYVDIEPQISVRSMGTSARNRVYFSAKSEEHNLDELLDLAGIEPTRAWEKGDRRGKGEKWAIPRHNGFIVQPYTKETGEVEDKLLALINLLLPYKANLDALSTIAYIGINIAYWGDQTSMGGVHFDTKTIQGLATLNLSIDLDLYASGPDLEE